MTTSGRRSRKGRTVGRDVVERRFLTRDRVPGPTMAVNRVLEIPSSPSVSSPAGKTRRRKDPVRAAPMTIPAAFPADSAAAIRQCSRRCKDVVSNPMPQSKWRASANELRRQQIAQSRQVVRGEIEQRMRANLVQAARHQTAQRADVLHPARSRPDSPRA